MAADSASSSAVRPVHWQAVHDLFVAALEVDDDEREALIARETSDHPALAQEVSRLLQLHGAAGTFLETVHGAEAGDSERLLADGDVVADRFEVVQLLGRGGMAEVYAARDPILGEQVALKVMRSSGDSQARTALFRREVQLARRVTHGGVCRVHDVAFHRRRDGQPLLVFTMELLAGGTLAEELRRGPLSRDRARAIATEIATALDAAHAHGILHGDIKPENVILETRHDGATRVVLTDFGLAKGLDAIDHPVSGSGLLGTPAYMAPELFRGVAPSIASDLYAFALLTYRLLSEKDDLWRTTRVVAFSGGATSRLPTGINNLDPGSRRVLTKALSVNPTERFSSATDFVRTLFPQPAARRQRILIATGLAVTAAVVALSVGPLLRVSQPASGDPLAASAPSPLLLTSTINDTGDGDLDGMTELLRAQLAQSVRLDVLSPEIIPGVLREMRQDPKTPADPARLREVALRRLANLVLHSQVTLAGTTYSLDLALEQIGAHPSIVEKRWHQTFEATDRDQLPDVVRRAATWVRTALGESKQQLYDQDRLPSEITTASWSALRAFAKAQDSQARADLSTAITYLQEAVRLDPEFVSAYARLGSILNSVRREDEAFAAWQQAVGLANRRGLTSREALRLRMQYVEETGSPAEAEEASRAYVLHYPNDFTANIYLGMMIAQRGRTEEAVPWFEHAVRLRPTDPAGHVNLAIRLIELERLNEAAATVDGLRQSKQPEWATWLSALIAFTRGNLGEALERLEPLRESNDRLWRSRFHTLYSSWLVEAGRPADAEHELANGLAFDAENGLRDRAALKWLHVAQLRGRAGDRDASADAVKKALAVSNDARTLATAGAQFAQLGMVGELRQVRDALAQYQPVSRKRLAQQLVDARLQLALGQRDDALRSLDAFATDRQITESWVDYTATLVAAGREAEALAMLADWVRHPARFYDYPEPPSPGPWATAVEEYRALLIRHANAQEAAGWQARLLSFRADQKATHGR
jgi:serine/threonine protein kinase/Flp pilus assembly protein TadD